jgi:lactobin A/cerein 7B family class IIb bacteriocin
VDIHFPAHTFELPRRKTMADSPENHDQDTITPEKSEELSQKDLEQVSGGIGPIGGGSIGGGSIGGVQAGWIEVTGDIQKKII